MNFLGAKMVKGDKDNPQFFSACCRNVDGEVLFNVKSKMKQFSKEYLLMKFQLHKFLLFIYLDKNGEAVLVMSLTVPSCEEFFILRTWPGLYCLFKMIEIVLVNPGNYSSDMVSAKRYILNRASQSLLCGVLEMCTGVSQMIDVRKVGSCNKTRMPKDEYLLMIYRLWTKYPPTPLVRFVIESDASVKMYSESFAISFGGLRDATYVFNVRTSLSDCRATKAMYKKNINIILGLEYTSVFDALMDGLMLFCDGDKYRDKDLSWLLLDAQEAISKVASTFDKAEGPERFEMEDMVDEVRQMPWEQRITAVSNYLKSQFYPSSLGHFQLAALCLHHNINLILYEVELGKLSHQPWMRCYNKEKFLYDLNFVSIRILNIKKVNGESEYRLLTGEPVDELQFKYSSSTSFF
jgi:hypothetical protein